MNDPKSASASGAASKTFRKSATPTASRPSASKPLTQNERASKTPRRSVRCVASALPPAAAESYGIPVSLSPGSSGHPPRHHATNSSRLTRPSSSASRTAMASAPGSFSSSSEAKVAAYGSQAIASRTSAEAESAADRRRAATSARETKPSASSSNRANRDATRMASDSDNAKSDGRKSYVVSATESSSSAPSRCTPDMFAVSGVFRTASSTHARSDAKRRVASTANAASRAVPVTPGREANAIFRFSLFFSPLRVCTASTNACKSVNPKKKAFATNVVKMTTCANDSTANAPPTPNARTSTIDRATAPTSFGNTMNISPSFIAATSNAPEKMASEFFNRRNMESATTALTSTASACVRISLKLLPTIMRRSFAGVSTPSAAKSRAMTLAADSFMCTPSTVSSARVASTSDIDVFFFSSSSSSSSLFFFFFLRTETSKRSLFAKCDSRAGSAAFASGGSSAARVATVPRSARPRANAAAAPRDTRSNGDRDPRSPFPREAGFLSLGGPRTSPLVKTPRRDAGTGARVARDPAERRSMLRRGSSRLARFVRGDSRAEECP